MSDVHDQKDMFCAISSYYYHYWYALLHAFRILKKIYCTVNVWFSWYWNIFKFGIRLWEGKSLLNPTPPREKTLSAIYCFTSFPNLPQSACTGQNFTSDYSQLQVIWSYRIYVTSTIAIVTWDFAQSRNFRISGLLRK